MQTVEGDELLFHSLYRNEESGEIEHTSTREYLAVAPNAIDDTFGDVLDREIKRSMGGLGQ